MRKNILISKILICVMLIVYVVPINAFADSRTAVGLHIVRNEYVQHYQGQPFDRDNINVSVLYNDGYIEKISDSQYDIFGYNSDAAGSKQVTISYGELSQKIDIDILPADFVYNVGEEKSLTVKTNNISGVLWESSDQDVVKITDTSTAYVSEKTESQEYRGYKQNADVKALEPGVSVITCKVKETGIVYAQAVISVIAPVEHFNLNKTDIYLAEGTETSVSPVIVPLDAAEKRLSYVSDNPDIASVNRNGKISGKTKGDTVITAYSWNGIHTARCFVHVIRPVENIEIKDNSIILNDREKLYDINAVIFPEDATFKGITYTSMNDNVAIVTDNGTVKATGNGETDIIIKSEDGFVSVSLHVKVEGLVSGIHVNTDKIDFNEKGQKFMIDAYVEPNDSVNKSLHYSSNYENVAIVDETGVVTAVGTGIAQITVTSEDGGFTAVINVEVHEPCTVTFKRVRDFKYTNDGATWTTVNILEKEVKWGDTITAEAIPIDGYIFQGIYTDFQDDGEFAGEIALHSEIKVKEDIELFVKYNNIVPDKIDLELADWGTTDQTFNVQCFSTPVIVDNQHFTLTSSNPAIASFGDGSASREYSAYSSQTSAIIVNIEGEGDVTLRADTVPFESGQAMSSDVLYLKIYKNKYGDYCVVDKNSPEGILFESHSSLRLFGNNRYDTSIMIADALKKAYGISEFENIIIASGNDYADALAGSYLAKIKKAPIIVVGDDSGSKNQVFDYIKNNLKSEGRVYILGGTGAVSSDFENKLKDYDVKRLAGSDRWLTNLEILKETGAVNKEMIICSGMNFADSLSASAAGKPILLVGDKLYDKQKEYLDQLKNKKYYLIGGTGAVSANISDDIKKYGNIKRLSGANRYETSLELAREFFGYDKEHKTVVLAYGLNFPDGLSGGPLAMAMDAPLLLIDSRNTQQAAKYVKGHKAYQSIITGGTVLISDAAVKEVMG